MNWFAKLLLKDKIAVAERDLNQQESLRVFCKRRITHDQKALELIEEDIHRLRNKLQGLTNRLFTAEIGSKP